MDSKTWHQVIRWTVCAASSGVDARDDDDDDDPDEEEDR